MCNCINVQWYIKESEAFGENLIFQKLQFCKYFEVYIEGELTGLSLWSMKNILICISNSPQPDSFTSYGGFVTTVTKKNVGKHVPAHDSNS